MKLRKCICGGEPSRYPGKDDLPDELRIIHCEQCDLSTLGYADGRRAATAWNKIIAEKIEGYKNEK